MEWKILYYSVIKIDNVINKRVKSTFHICPFAIVWYVRFDPRCFGYSCKWSCRIMLKKKTTLFIAVLLSTFQLSCTAANNDISPNLNKDAFEGFTIIPTKISLEGYEYKKGNRKTISFNSCKQALDYDISNIAGHDYFRFKLLLVSCKAVNKYKNAKSSTKTFFPAELTSNHYKFFPALSTPYLSKTEYQQRQNKTINQTYKSLKITSKNNTATLITKEDEIYVTILARGDFNNDNIEDLLVSSEWYARNAHGKHTDLIILSKIGKDKAIEIDWRLNTIK